MQLKSSIEIIIRIVFFFLFSIQFLGLIWVGELSGAIHNISSIFLLISMLFVIFKSIEYTNKYLYSIVGAIGFLITIYFMYETTFILENPIEPYVIEAGGFIVLIILSFTSLPSSKLGNAD